MGKLNRIWGKQPERRKKLLKILAAVVLSLIVLAVTAAIGATIYWNYMLNLLGDAEKPAGTAGDTFPTATVPVATDILTETTLPETTSAEETWPQVVSDENITNIMLIGQSFREGEESRLSDTMILCSLNREQKTLTMVSILRDLYVPLPAYAGHGPGRNRINVCYALGSLWTGKPQGGMEMLAKCVEQNFGIPIDHSIEIDFTGFTQIIDTLGGVEIDLTEEEARYLTDHVGYVGSFEPGLQTLDGNGALAYARIRKIDGDIQRTGRQRILLESLLKKCRKLGLLDLHKLAVTVLPMLTTDMEEKEITNYVWEILPMLKQLEIRSLTCPVDNEALTGSFWSREVDIAGVLSYVLECNTTLNGQYLRSYLGMKQEE